MMTSSKSVFLGLATLLAALPIASRAGNAQPLQDMNAMHGQMPSSGEAFPFGHPGTAARVDRIIRITATEFGYLPAVIRVRTGETVEFVVTNKGVFDHEFFLGTVAAQHAHEKEMAAHPDTKMDDPNGVSIPPGASATLIWTFTKPMTIQYACHVPGHYAAGMYGVLTITRG